METLHHSVKSFQEKLAELNFTNEVKQLPDSTRTAQEAASTIDCEVAQIAKSIIFRLEQSGEPLLVVASGSNRVNEKQIEKHLADKLGKADAAFVRENTGYAIGGVPPLGHKQSIQTFIDEDLLQYTSIWAAAEHPKAVFQLTPDELVDMTKGQVVSVT